MCFITKVTAWSVQIRSFFWTAFSWIRTEYGGLRSKKKISVLRTRKKWMFWNISQTSQKQVITKWTRIYLIKNARQWINKKKIDNGQTYVAINSFQRYWYILVIVDVIAKILNASFLWRLSPCKKLKISVGFFQFYC